MKPKIYITRKLPANLVNQLSSQFDVRMWEKEDVPVPKDVLVEEIKHVDGVISLLTEQIDKEVLDQAHKLQIIANMAVGYDNIDVDYAREIGIIVTNTPDVLTESTADLTFALLMATARRIVEANDYIRNDQWDNWGPYLLAGSDIFGKTIGLVGMGRIGQAVARRAKGFGMSILYHNRNRNLEAEEELQATYTSFEALLANADYIVSLLPLTTETRHKFNKPAFDTMKQSAIFINASRGQVVDEEALFNALHSKQIKAAGLDVFEAEPIRSDHPLVNSPNVVCLPHIGSATIETRTKMIQLCVDNMKDYFFGEGPITPINK
ncbi:D-glycerate dehydrogenase [Ornithinibacillus sp. L9]|uniref:D-glycerate dehydrogenase n=1 Tax=Ornithinibacillus caprae TaxID=2678566 RepID=A0A6N8FNH3_9BACI|nr:D-glycerate dehydrogenase [Ornithinibacillus caprae]MUK90014.1 D-glycerate dehydrogenase [Ornithinibacillus caprae]